MILTFNFFKYSKSSSSTIQWRLLKDLYGNGAKEVGADKELNLSWREIIGV